MTKNKVLVLGNDTNSFLAVIRSLGRKKIEVHVGCCSKDAPALGSRYVSKFHDMLDDIAPINIQALTSILSIERFQMVISCSDTITASIQLHREIFNKFPELHLLQKEVFIVTSSKLFTTDLARSLSINVPKSCLINHFDNGQVELGEYDFPIVLKPISSMSLDKPDANRKYVRKVFTLRELNDVLPTMLLEGDVLAQENFIGTGMGIECLANNGEILTAFQHVRVHEPIHGGGSSYRMSAPLDKEMYAATVKLISSLKYTGVAMVEFKKNIYTGKWVLIEINARFWGSLPLSITSGIDFPFYLYQMLVLKIYSFNKEYKNGIYCRNLYRDFWWFIANFHADKKDKTIESKPVFSVLMELRNLFAGLERSDTIVIDDIVPALIDFYQLAKDIFSRFPVKLLISALQMKYFRKMYIYYILIRMKNARSVAFVCKGNICRSSFAEKVFQKTFSEVHTASFGFISIEGRSSPDEAVQAARELGVDLSTHQSKKLTREIIANSDIIFIFDRQNLRSIIKISPLSASKSFFLGAFTDNNLEIDDPYGKSTTSYIDTYNIINDCIVKIQNRI
jgi:protein-tyrosine-phosphatase/predicted ATP-grasp superfamily ATP-dependent carboligase